VHAIGPVADQIYHEARFGQALRQVVAGLLLVFDDQDLRRCPLRANAASALSVNLPRCTKDYREVMGLSAWCAVSADILRDTMQRLLEPDAGQMRHAAAGWGR
jgi:hypothetical protein